MAKTLSQIVEDFFNATDRLTCNGSSQARSSARLHFAIIHLVLLSQLASVSDSEFYSVTAAKFKQVQVCLGPGAESSSAHKTPVSSHTLPSLPLTPDARKSSIQTHALSMLPLVTSSSSSSRGSPRLRFEARQGFVSRLTTGSSRGSSRLRLEARHCFVEAHHGFVSRLTTASSRGSPRLRFEARHGFV